MQLTSPVIKELPDDWLEDDAPLPEPMPDYVDDTPDFTSPDSCECGRCV